MVRGSRLWTHASFGGALPVAASVLMLAACGSGGDAPPDGAAVPDGGEGLSFTPPDIPWLAAGLPPIAPPVLTPCPDGWREVPPELAGEPTTCDPYGAGGPLDCPVGQAHFPGEPGCAPVGAPCPVGDFAEGLPVDRRVIYVQPGSMGGDGSETAPYGSLSEVAVGGLPIQTVIALSRGMHREPVRLARELVVQGACAEATVLSVAEPHSDEGVVNFIGSGGAARDLTLADSPRPGIRIAVSGAEGSVEGVVVRATKIVAVLASRGARLSAQTVSIRDTVERDGDGAVGRGLSLESGATGTVSRAVLSRNRDSAVFVRDPGTSLTLSDATVRRTRTRATDDTIARGLTIVLDATADVGRVGFSQNRSAAVVLEDQGDATLSDVVVRDTEGLPDGRLGRGLSLVNGASATSSRVLLSDNRDVGVYVSRMDSMLTLSDAVVRETRSRLSDGNSGRGLSVQNGAVAVVSRVLLARNQDAGVHASEMGTSVTLADVTIADTESRARDAHAGRGLNVQNGASAEATRALLSGNRDLAAAASEEGTVLTLSDVVVRDTESNAINMTSGRGVNVQRGASLELSRAVLSRNRELALYAAENPSAVVQDVVISHTRPRACVETTCIGMGGGHGVGSYEPGTTLSMTRFSIEGSALCGLQLARDGAIDLSDGEVFGQPIGACLQVEGYDTASLTTRVSYHDNDVNLQTTTLPVPEPAEAFGGAVP